MYLLNRNQSDKMITLRARAFNDDIAFRNGKIEMSNLSTIVIALTGFISIVFFMMAPLITDTTHGI